MLFRLYGLAAFARYLPHLAPQAGRLQRSLDGRDHLVQIEGLVREMVGAQFMASTAISTLAYAVNRITRMSWSNSLMARSTETPSVSGSL